jgi:hypothetical protein
MLRIDKTKKRLIRLEKPTMTEVGLTERGDLQEMIKNNPDAFFSEMGEKLLLLGDEVKPTDFVQDRIDLLAIDQQGTLVVIELKKGSNKLHLLQALSYAAMVSRWDSVKIMNTLQSRRGNTEEEVEELVEQFLLQDVATLNDTQRIVLIAEGFDYEVLATAEWLSDVYKLDIRCYRLSLAAEGDNEFLGCTCVFPPPEITEHAIRRGPKGPVQPCKWKDWEAALEGIENTAVVDFVRHELDAGREHYLPKRMLRYRIQGKRRFGVHARKKHAYVWQNGRFAADEQYWRETIGEHIKLEPTKEGQCLRFHLINKEDFDRFSEAVESGIQGREFRDHAEDMEE